MLSFTYGEVTSVSLIPSMKTSIGGMGSCVVVGGTGVLAGAVWEAGMVGDTVTEAGAHALNNIVINTNARKVDESGRFISYLFDKVAQKCA
jgi:hypothetical protein